ncbi:phosphatase PAP2 family protein [Sphingomonas sp. ID1715]|uniref:phosphatase PAP2 family protein n=1 Tax=Sphingomonas sp. ID1715 TaxID=1656898 RepID=UPI0014878447|nr:phosphatase PAP2 family protein [Sphingomonas sp. ID1715]NNM77179.1 phosphatase PAP2 family protein [Sphingomonas sp. ID1715]
MGKKRKAIKQVEQADVEVSRSIADWKDSGAVRALGWFGKLTDQPPLYAFIGGVAAAALVRRDGRLLRTAGRMLVAHWVGIRGKDAVKKAVDRTRPQMLIDEGRYESGKGQRDEKPFNSFPSGHTVGAVAVARALARDYPEYTVPAYGLAGLAAVARIAKCDHFVSDTAAGALIGIASEAVSVYRAGRQGFPSYSKR